jgi:hypothetical protein
MPVIGRVFPMHDFANSRYVMLWGTKQPGEPGVVLRLIDAKWAPS